MAELAQKRYKGIEFSDSIEMVEGDFNKAFGNCHIFKRMTEQEKKTELNKAWKIAVPNPPKPAKIA